MLHFETKNFLYLNVSKVKISPNISLPTSNVFKMKAKLIFLSFIFLFFGLFANAQLPEKLIQLAKEKGMETQEVSYDSSSYDSSNDQSDEEGINPGNSTKSKTII